MRTQFICLAFVIVLLCPFVSAQWVQTNGPYGGEIRALAVSGTNLYAGTWDSGVFLSTNNGASWRAVNAGLGNHYVSALAVSDTNLFAGTYDGVFLSTNNGTSWTSMNSGLQIRKSPLLLSAARISLPCALQIESESGHCAH
jgi:ligand-binding sensor domain-containing protein